LLAVVYRIIAEWAVEPAPIRTGTME